MDHATKVVPKETSFSQHTICRKGFQIVVGVVEAENNDDGFV